MKLASLEGEVRTNITDAGDYNISTSGKMYEILYHNIYSDPIAAVVREICSNAYDSHIQAGCEKTPFRVILPNPFHPFFEVEDFGIGMSKDDVETIYRSYGRSTKSDKNDQVGGFGLGSKTPFAYSSTFTVRTRKDGVECTYMNYIGESGTPKLKQLSEKQTDQANGVKVTVPVNKDDFFAFRNHASHFLSFYQNRPEVVGHDFEFEVSQQEVDLFYKYGVAKFGDDRSYIVSGCVPYPCNLGGSLLVPIGFVQPTASRESLDCSNHKLSQQLSEMYQEKLSSAEKSIREEYCSSSRLVSRLSALKNTGAMEMVLRMIEVVSSKEYRGYNRFVLSDKNSSSIHQMVWSVMKGLPITILYGDASDYKRRFCARMVRANGQVLVQLKGRANTNPKTISTLMKAFPNGEIGISWKSYQDVYESRIRTKSIKKPKVANTGLVFGKNGNLSIEAVDSINPVDCDLIFSKSWNSIKSKTLIRSILKLPTVVYKKRVLLNNTKRNQKLFEKYNQVQLEDWKVQLDDDTVASAVLSRNQRSSIESQHFFCIIDSILKHTTFDPSIVSMVKEIVRLERCREGLRQTYYLSNLYVYKDRIANWDTVETKVKTLLGEFDHWWDDQCSLDPILRYNAQPKDVIYYIKKRNNQ